ncbi:MAG: radical SAM protein [Calditrichaceae bacterium]
MIAFGPITSGRLGKCLGINNLPSKICTYSCSHCRVGKIKSKKCQRSVYLNPQDIFADLQDLIIKTKENNDKIDFLTIIPAGEPTLDQNLGRIFDLVRFFNIKLAVITNGSLLYNDETRADLCKADWVSIKIDSVDEGVWQKLNNPHHQLNLRRIMQGQLRFADEFNGSLNTETMLVEGINTGTACVEQTAEFIARLNPAVSYISAPIGSPASGRIVPPTEETVNRVFQNFNRRIKNVEYLLDYNDGGFDKTGRVEEDLLNLLAVQPMRIDALIRFLQETHSDWRVVDKLIARKQIINIPYEGHQFYMRRFSGLSS